MAHEVTLQGTHADYLIYVTASRSSALAEARRLREQAKQLLQEAHDIETQADSLLKRAIENINADRRASGYKGPEIPLEVGIKQEDDKVHLAWET